MKGKLLLLTVLVILAGTAYWLARTDKGTTLSGPLTGFTVADTSAVTRIFIADPAGATVDLKRTERGWTVNDMDLARPGNVDLVLKTFLRAEVRSPVPKSAEANVLRVMAIVGKKVEIYEGGSKPSKIWYVGHATQDHFGTHMLLEVPGKGRSSAPFIIGMSGFTGHLSSRFHTDTDEWRIRRMTRYRDVHDIAEIRVEHPLVPDRGFRLVNDGDDALGLFDLDGQPLPFDTTAAKDFLFRHLHLNFESFVRDLSPSGRDSLLATIPNHIATLRERDGRTHTWKYWLLPYTGEEPEEGPMPINDHFRMYALVQDTVIVTVQRHVFDRTLPPVDMLLP